MKLEEVRIQIALGTIPESLRMPFVRGCKMHTAKTNHVRHCKLCEERIMKGQSFFAMGLQETINICEDCSYMSIVQVVKSIDK